MILGFSYLCIIFFVLLSIFLTLTCVLLYLPQKLMAQTIPPQSTITIIPPLENPTNITKTGIENVSTGIDRVNDLYYPDMGIPGSANVDVDVAIIAGGIDIDHPDLNVYQHTRFVKNSTSDDDICGGGTHVGGIVGAKYNGIGVIGIAPNARLWSIKVVDYDKTTGRCEGSVQTLVDGINYVAKKASQIDIAVLPLGFLGKSPELDSAIDRAIAAGVTFVAAAGHLHKDVSLFSPASHKDVITVSAIVDTDGKCGAHGSFQFINAGEFSGFYSDDEFAEFSNYGKGVDIAAPGVKIQSTNRNGTYAISSGTQIAAAEVAGAAALYKSANPRLSPSEILDILRNSGSTANTICNGNGRGYIDSRYDFDNIREPLLYVSIFPFLDKKNHLEELDSTVESGIRLASDPSGLGINPNTRSIYVANRGSDTISVMDESTNRIVGNISLNTIPVNLAVNPNTNRLYVANTISNTISVIDSITNNMIMDSIPVGKDPADIVIDPENNLIFVSNSGDNTVSVISDFTLKKITDIPVGNRPVGLSINLLSNRLYVANMGSNTVSIIDYFPGSSKFTYTPILNVSVGRGPFMITFNPITNMVYVTNSASNSVYEIDGLTTNPVANITVGKRPLGIDINPYTNMVYVTNSASNSVSMINGLTKNVTNIPVGYRPVDVIVNPTENIIYIANAGSRTLHTINGTTNQLTVGITYNVNPPNSGYINCNNQAIYTNYVKYNIGTEIRCDAVANTGFKFSSWSSHDMSLSNSTNPLKFTADKQGATFTVNFVQSISLDKSLQRILFFLGLLTPVSAVLAIIDAFSKSKRPKILGGIGALIVIIIGVAFIFTS